MTLENTGGSIQTWRTWNYKLSYDNILCAHSVHTSPKSQSHISAQGHPSIQVPTQRYAMASPTYTTLCSHVVQHRANFSFLWTSQSHLETGTAKRAGRRGVMGV